MGDRAQVRIIDYAGNDCPDVHETGGVYLYTHWHGYQLQHVVARALEFGRSRWRDDEYLARIVFEEMLKLNPNSTTGFGIGTHKHSDIELLITLNCRTTVATVEYVYEPHHAKNGKYTFEEFINEFGAQDE